MLKTTRIPRYSATLTALVLAACACGGATPEPTAPSELSPEPTAEVAAPQDEAIAVEGLFGTIPEDDVRKTVEGSMGSFLQCYEKGYDINDGIEGTVELAMEVGPQGNVLSAFVKRSDLGALVTEGCIVQRAKRLEFPPTQGGGNAEISYGFLFQAPYDLPEIEQWETARFEKILQSHAEAIEACTGGKPGVTLTVFVNKDGSILTAGAASNTLDTYDAATCLAELAASWQLDTPAADMARAILYF